MSDMRRGQWCEDTVETPIARIGGDRERQSEEKRDEATCSTSDCCDRLTGKNPVCLDVGGVNRRPCGISHSIHGRLERHSRSCYSRTASCYSRTASCYSRTTSCYIRRLLATLCLLLISSAVNTVAANDFASHSDSYGTSDLESLLWMRDSVSVADGLQDVVAVVGKAFRYELPAEAFRGYVDRYEVRSG